MLIRRAVPADAEAYIALLRELDAETSFLLWEPGERTLVPAAVRDRLADTDPSRLTLVAEDEMALVGFLVGFRGAQRRISHRADLTMGVRQFAWGRGVGSQLLQAFEHWALALGLKRLELTVHGSNARAMSLYERAGFLLEGRKSGAIIINDVPVDECVMGKALA